MTTFAQLARLQPELRRLEQQVLASHAPGPTDWKRWEGVRSQLSTLVGRWARGGPDARLGSHQAWEVAYEHLVGGGQGLSQCGGRN